MFRKMSYQPKSTSIINVRPIRALVATALAKLAYVEESAPCCSRYVSDLADLTDANHGHPLVRQPIISGDPRNDKFGQIWLETK